jgi:hypothetical protein
MNNDIGYDNNPRNGKALAGIVLLILGVILLFQQFNIFDNLELWPLALVGLGFYLGTKSNFKKPSSYILIVLGVLLLISKNVPHADGITWPIGIIAFGLWMILRRRSNVNIAGMGSKIDNKWDWKPYPGQEPYKTPDPSAEESEPAAATPPPGQRFSYGPTGDDYLDSVSVFGGVKKSILSKDFKGGEVVNIFGGAELNFIQADINGRVVIDITQIFGSTKIIVPSHWQVVSDIAAVFAGIDDKRIKNLSGTATGDKILVLKGVSIFAGVDIRSY